jgi:two-component system OmpR family response regulator
LRRYRSLPQNLRADEARKIRFAGWTLDIVARHLVSAEGVVSPLSGSEFQLLRVLLSHANHVLTRDQIMLLARGRESDPLERTVDLHVSRLRHRLGDDGDDPRIIKTVRGQGYVLAVPVELER